MDKKLLRRLKQEGFSELDYDNELVTSALVADYNKSHDIPLELWTYDMLQTRLEEMLQLELKLSVLFPEYYREVYYYHGGEYYDIMDEIDRRFYIDYADYYPFYGQ